MSHKVTTCLVDRDVLGAQWRSIEVADGKVQEQVLLIQRQAASCQGARDEVLQSASR